MTNNLSRGKQWAVVVAFTAALVLAPCVLQADQAVYVSPSGSDSNPGTPQKPIQTLQHARDLVRSVNARMAGDIIVYLMGGTYRLSQPLALEPADSGQNGHNIIYAAVQGQHPVISGGLQVTGWKLIDPSKNLWSAPAPAGLVNSRQLYVNGVRAPRARGFLPVTVTETDTGYTASAPAMDGWRNPSDMEFIYTGGNSLWGFRSVALGAWTEPRCPVGSIDGTTITMAQPCWDNSTKRVMLPKDSKFKRPANLVGPASIGKEPSYVENAYELLGRPGEWYFDRKGGTIYYVPRRGENLATADVEIPALETLVSGNGTEGNPVHNIIFRGLQFSYATWLYPSSPEGFSEIQANYMVTGSDGYATQGLCDLAPNGQCPFGAWTPASANVTFSYDHDIQFTGDAFVHLGGAGLALGNGSQSDTVQGCVFTDISANGIEIGNVDLPEGNADQVTRDNRVLNNHIYNVAAEFRGGIGICVGYTQRTLIQYNQLDHLPYSGISLGWGGWMDKIDRAGIANISQNNMVANNLIFDHMMLLADGGGIYTQGLTGPDLANGEKLIGNVIFNQFGTGHGIYTDNGCKNVTAKGNVIFHTDHDNWGGRHRDHYEAGATGFDAFDFEGNYWQQGEPDGSRDNVTLKDNQIISSLSQVPGTIIHGAGIRPEYNAILAEHFGAPAAPEPPVHVSAASGAGCAYVAWNQAPFEGGAPVQSYTVIGSNGARTTISRADFRTNAYAVVPGLADGTSCSFTVTANNANGSSTPSLSSEPITVSGNPSDAPSAPNSVSVYPGNGMVSLHFQAPDKLGGSPVLGYLCTINPGGRQVKLTGRPYLVLAAKHATFGVIDGLQNGTQYTFAVAAVNAAGAGANAAPVTATPGSAAVAPAGNIQ